MTEEEQSGNSGFQWQPAPTDSTGVIDDLDCKVYGYSNVSPTDVLDLHCKAVLGIKKGVVQLPKYKTLKLGLQIQGTDLYLTMLYSREMLWVPGDGFKAGPAPTPGADSQEKDNIDVDSDGSTNCGSGTESKSGPSRGAPTPRKRASASSRSGGQASKGNDDERCKGKQSKGKDDGQSKGKSRAPDMATEKTYTTDHWLRFSGQTPLTVRTYFDESLAAKAKETTFEKSP